MKKRGRPPKIGHQMESSRNAYKSPVPAKEETVGISETPNPASEKQEVRAWLRTIQNTVQHRDGIGKKAGWSRFISEYKNDWDFLKTSVSIPIIPINLVYAYVKTEIARLYFRDPWITVNPKRVEDLGAAQIAEQIINYTWGEIKLKAQMKQALLETLLVGHSWIKVGYSAEFGTVESQPKQEPKGPGRPKKIDKVETNEYIKSESVFAYHVPHTDIIFDPSATYPCTHNARWMAHKIVKPYRAIVESGLYEHTEDLNISGESQDPNAPYDSADSLKEPMGKDVRSVILWEIYDLDHKAITTVSPGCPYKLREIPYPDYLNEGFPFIQFAFNPVPGEVYPMSDVAPHEGQIIELIKMVSIEINHLKRWNRQMIVDAGTFTDEQMGKFKDANDGAIIEAQIQGARDKIFIPPYAPVQSDIYGVFNQIFQLWQMISGQTSTDQGGQARTQTRTLGELRMSLQGSKARPEEKVDTLEDSIEEVARKMLTIIQKKYTLPKIARIVGSKSVQERILKILPQRPSAQPNMMTPQGPQPNPVANQSFSTDFAFSWNKDDIIGEMDVDVVAGSTVPMDRESQLQIMEKMGPVLAIAGIQPGTPPAREFAKEVVRLTGVMGLEPIIDSVQGQPMPPSPKLMETQAKIQGKQAETVLKLKAKQAEEALKLQAMKEKLAIDQQKNQMDLHKNTMDMILKQFRSPVVPQLNGDTF